MKTVKKTVIIYLDAHPMDNEGQMPWVVAHVANPTTPPPSSDVIRRAFEVTLDVPVRYESLPAKAVKAL